MEVDRIGPPIDWTHETPVALGWKDFLALHRGPAPEKTDHLTQTSGTKLRC